MHKTSENSTPEQPTSLPLLFNHDDGIFGLPSYDDHSNKSHFITQSSENSYNIQDNTRRVPAPDGTLSYKFAFLSK
jgi:hypothetical protein